MKTFQARNLLEWRSWLAAHHDTESVVWLVFPKRHTGEASISYGDALDEALCFGWIDSLVKRLDKERYARKFNPRKADSSWSAINRERYAKLKASGRLMPAGLRRPPTDRISARPPAPTRLPGYIRAALRRHPAARRTFEGLAPSYRRNYLSWIDSAKQQETKMRRLAEAIRMLAAGRKLELK